MKDRFNALCVVSLLAFCVALAAVRAAHASTPREAERVLWYLRGQADVVFPNYGWTVQEIGCRPTRGPFAYCWIRVYRPEKRKSYCGHALYRTKGHAIVGRDESTPKPCNGKEGPQS